MGLVPPPRSIPGTPQTRCREEFDRLFTLKYHQRFDHGLVIRPGKSRIRLDYRTASAGIGTAEMGAPNLPDVVEQAATTRKLTDLVDAVTNELDAYSRWLGRNPDGRGSLGAAALLPAELVDNRTGNVGELLGHLGIGIEPDVRFGGPVLAPGPAVLFRTGQQGSQTASSTFNAATILLHLAVAVGQADGQVSASEHEHLVAHLETALGLPQPEQVRLRAHLQWLLAAGVKLSGLKKRLEALRSDQRLSIADFLLNVAAADGVIAPGEVTTLTKIYTLLGLDPSMVYGQLHERVTGVPRPQPSTGPVVVRPAGASSPGFTLPSTPPTPPPSAHGGDSLTISASAPPRQVVLDRRLIDEKIAETGQVAALLSTIFTEDEPTATPPVPSGQHAGPASITQESGHADVQTPPIAGLDHAHSRLLRDLATSPTWTLQSFEDLTNRHDVLPSGALDVLHEAAIDTTGDPVIEGDEDLTINQDVLQEMLG